MRAQYSTHELLRTVANNDPLAHVYVLMDSYDGALAEHRIYQEFITDIGERLPDQPFRREFAFNLQNGQLVSDTGLNMRNFLNSGYQAAVMDVQNGAQPLYAAARAEALLRQGEQVERWASDGVNDTDVIFYSLCPPEEEVATIDAIRQNFKPDRMMASVQRYSKRDNQIIMEAYSLDGMLLSDIEAMHTQDEINTLADTTLEQLFRAVTVDTHKSTDNLIDTYDLHKAKQLRNNTIYTQGVDMITFKQEANKAVESCPEAWKLYSATIKEITGSLQKGTVTSGLESIVSIQSSGFVERGLLLPNFLRIREGQQYTEDSAAELLNHLRKEAIPHYIVKLWQQDTTRTESGGASFGDAGADSVASGVSYEGACPESGIGNTITQETSALNEVFGRKNSNILACVTCPFCHHTVDAELTAKTISCPREECGAVLDLKTNERIDAKNSVMRNSMNNNLENEDTNKKLRVNKQTSDKTISMQLANAQDDIWVIKYKIYNQDNTEEERRLLYTELFTLTETKNTLLRQKI